MATVVGSSIAGWKFHSARNNAELLFLYRACRQRRFSGWKNNTRDFQKKKKKKKNKENKTVPSRRFVTLVTLISSKSIKFKPRSTTGCETRAKLQRGSEPPLFARNRIYTRRCTKIYSTVIPFIFNAHSYNARALHLYAIYATNQTTNYATSKYPVCDVPSTFPSIVFYLFLSLSLSLSLSLLWLRNNATR